MVKNKTPQGIDFLIRESDRDVERLVEIFGQGRRSDIERTYLGQLITYLGKSPAELDFIPILAYRTTRELITREANVAYNVPL